MNGADALAARADACVRMPGALWHAGLLDDVCAAYTVDVVAAPGGGDAAPRGTDASEAAALAYDAARARVHAHAAFAPDAGAWVLGMRAPAAASEPCGAFAALADALAADAPHADAGVRTRFFASRVAAGPPPFDVVLYHTDSQGAHVLTSAAPGVPSAMPPPLWAAFRRAREESPAPGMSPAGEVARAIGVLLRILGNALSGNARPVAVHGKSFSQHLRWDESCRTAATPSPGLPGPPLADAHVSPPPPPASPSLPPAAARSDPGSPFPPAAPSPVRMRTLRIFLELAAWCVHLGGTLPTWDLPAAFQVRVAPLDVTALLGAPRPRAVSDARLGTALATLGAAPDASESEVCLAYRINTQLFPHRAQTLFLALDDVHRARHFSGEQLPFAVGVGRSQGRVTREDIAGAYERLGLSDRARDARVDADVVLAAFEDRVRDALDHGTDDRLAAATAALHTLAQTQPDAAPLAARAARNPIADAAHAYRLIQVAADVDDALLAVAYDVYIAESTSRTAILRHALAAIAADRQSDFLRRHLDGAAAEHAADLPCGLNNIGNTCYLNSVLQYFFSIRDVREAVQAMRTRDSPLTADAWHGAVLPTIGGRRVDHAELARSCTFVALLSDLFTQMQSAHDAVSPSHDLAYLALVPLAWEARSDGGPPAAPGRRGDAPELRGAPLGEESHSAGGAGAPPLRDTAQPLPDGPPCLRADAESPAAPAPPCLPREAPTPPSPRLLAQVNTQQDVSECLDNMVFQLDAALACHDAEAWTHASAPAVYRLFEGASSQQLYQDCLTDTREELFQSIPVTILPDAVDMYDALDTFFDDEAVLAGDGSTVRRSVSLARAPPLLQVHIQRVQYDRAGARAVKNQARLALQDTLYLDRYAHHDAAQRARAERAQALRARCAHVRARLAAIQEEPGTLDQLGVALAALRTSHADDGDVQFLVEEAGIAALRGEAAALRAEADALRAELSTLRTDVHALWADARDVEYRLASVFMHRGEATHGHYFLNQRDFATDQWVSYNDSRVHAISRAEVDRDPSGATSYLVVYVRADVQASRHLLGGGR
ncbi:ubiquitinyl hydrolase 1 [Malassezia sp. CBS 17886]|nr:ubiquitinyl hydrolase 1 [Malassezia sp. CBS 17886]